MTTEREQFDDQIDPKISTDPDTRRLMVYGIPNCSTVKKARAALEGAGVVVDFKDVRGQDMGLEDWEYLEGKVGWDALINRSSRTWRELDETTKAGLDRESALDLLIKHPTLMKRPAIDGGSAVTVGWTDNVRQQLGLEAA